MLDLAAIERACAWCGEPLPPRTRADRLTCSARCKKARQRAIRAAAEPVTTPAPPAAAGQVELFGTVPPATAADAGGAR